MTQLTRRNFLQITSAGVLATALPSFQIKAQAAEPASFTFAGINDLHMKDENCLPYVTRVVEAINANEAVSGVFVLGDLATAAKLEELELAKKALDLLEKPCFVLPGNHDLTSDQEDGLNRYNSLFGEEHWVKEWEQWAFMGFNSCVGTGSNITVPDSELAWMQKQLESIDQNRPLALFCHHPMNPHSKAYRILNADEILDLFSSHALRLVAAGHWHGNQEESTARSLFTTTACCSSTRDNFDKTSAKGYRMFHFEASTVDSKFVAVS
jgi:3',5'-cyclic AMP phosphodiesterase CpdA